AWAAYPFADRALPWPKVTRHGLVDNHDIGAVRRVIRAKASAFLKANSKCLKEICAYCLSVHLRHRLAPGEWTTLDSQPTAASKGPNRHGLGKANTFNTGNALEPFFKLLEESAPLKRTRVICAFQAKLSKDQVVHLPAWIEVDKALKP